MPITKMLRASVILLCLVVASLFWRNRTIEQRLNQSYSAHAQTLEYVSAAQMALKDGRQKAVPLASDSLDDAQVSAAVFFSNNCVANKDVVFIMEYNDESIIQSNKLTPREKFVMEQYIKKTRSRW